MRSLCSLSALLLAGVGLSACQPSSYVLVQLDGVPEAARSVKILVQRGSQVSTPLVPLSLPNTGTAGLSFRLDLPTDSDEAAPIEVQVGAFSRAGGDGCLLASGGARPQPRETASVHLTTVAMLEGCAEGDAVVQAVAPSLLATDSFATSELVLKGWGFQPDTQIRIDGQPVARMTFVSATEVRVLPSAAQRVGVQQVSAQNQGSIHISDGLLRYYANQVSYTVSDSSGWAEFGIPGTPTAVGGTALIRALDSVPRFTLLQTDLDTPGSWDLLYGYRVFGMQQSDRGGAVRLIPTLFGNQLKQPSQILAGPFDLEPFEDIAIIDSNRPDPAIPHKVGFRASIAGDVTFVYCSNIQDKSMRIAAITKRHFPNKPVADLVLGYDDGTFGVIGGTPRGIFVGPLTRAQNQCEHHKKGTNPEGTTVQSVQSMHFLRLPPMGYENYLLVANGRTSLVLIPPYDSSSGTTGIESTYYHTPYLLENMTDSPVLQVLTEDLDADGYTDLIIAYRRNNKAYIRIRKGLPAALIDFRNIAQFDNSIPEFLLANDCISATPIRLGDINEDGYNDILIGCTNSVGPSSIEAVLSRGEALKFGAVAQTVYQQAKNIDGTDLFFERMPQTSGQPVEIWGATSNKPLRLINTSR